MIAAMKVRDDVRVQTLRGALAAFTNALVANGKKPTEELSDSETVTVLKRLAKQRQDSIDQFTRGNRPELAAKEERELRIIEEYLPKKADREEIKKIARAKLAELGITDMVQAGMPAAMGKLIGAVMKELAERGDGVEVKAAISQMLIERTKM